MTSHGRPSRPQDRLDQSSRAERFVVCCMELFLRDYPKQVVSLAKAKSVPTNMREFLSWAQRHCCIDVTASTVERKHLLVRAQGGCKDFTHKGSNAHFIRPTCKICGTVQRKERHPPRQDPATCSHRHMDQRRVTRNTHTRKTCCVNCGTYIDSVQREIFNAIEGNTFNFFQSL